MGYWGRTWLQRKISFRGLTSGIRQPGSGLAGRHPSGEREGIYDGPAPLVRPELRRGNDGCPRHRGPTGLQGTRERRDPEPGFRENGTRAPRKGLSKKGPSEELAVVGGSMGQPRGRSWGSGTPTAQLSPAGVGVQAAQSVVLDRGSPRPCRAGFVPRPRSLARAEGGRGAVTAPRRGAPPLAERAPETRPGKDGAAPTLAGRGSQARGGFPPGVERPGEAPFLEKRNGHRLTKWRHCSIKECIGTQP
jgi:hypothetical protein